MKGRFPCRRSEKADSAMQFYAICKTAATTPRRWSCIFPCGRKFPILSLGTMYRNLNTLCKDGQILRLSDGGEEHYDAVAHNHAHLKCTCCGRFYDLPDLDNVLHTLPQTSAYAGEIRGCSLIFFGVCANCHRQAEQNI